MVLKLFYNFHVFLKLFLFKASTYGYLDIFNALIKAGADVNHKNFYKNTALISGI